MMEGHDFIALAGKLAASPADEATYRTAVGRAYYGAFHVARSFLVELGFQPVGNANVHAFVRHCLNGSGHPDAYIAATELGDLQTARNRSDYQLADRSVGSREFAMACVERAHRVVSALEQCRRDDDRSAIQLAIAEFQRKIHRR
jgi:uncharacterized protein (UPF0332 family)